METQQQREERIGPHFYYRIEGNVEVVVVPLTLGRARIIFGAVGDYYGWHTGYCYDDPILAVREAKLWPGKTPEGWTRAMELGKPNRYPDKK